MGEDKPTTTKKVTGSISEEEIVLGLGKKQIELGLIKDEVSETVLKGAKKNSGISLEDIRNLYFNLYTTTDDIVKFKMVEKYGGRKTIKRTNNKPS